MMITNKKVSFENGDQGLKVHYNLKTCTNCVLPETFPDITFDEEGVCNYCHDFNGIPNWNEVNLGEFIEKKKTSNLKYDCLVLYSGGKDSSFALKLLKEKYKLNILAMTLDNGYLSNVTSQNMKTVLDNLNIDHHIIKYPKSIMNEIYRGSIQGEFDKTTYMYSTTACGSCIGLVFETGVDLAKKLEIPLMAGGWTPGQMTDSAVLKSDFIQMLIDKYEQKMALISPNAWNHLGKSRSRVEVTQNLVNPLYVSNYKEEEIVEELKKIGWKQPKDTDSCSSNCRLNSFLLFDHIEKFQFHPYVYELAYHVRAGYMSKSEAMEKMTNLNVTMDYINGISKELEV
ncbi:queuosine biosynthesis QueC family protein (plasmid) [Bacillus pseudomycoides]|nr:queuosine biosynthesis QueC family protein [Bacillus pseudomycoides]